MYFSENVGIFQNATSPKAMFLIWINWRNPLQGRILCILIWPQTLRQWQKTWWEQWIII